jgi:hypothetical protein
MANRSSLLFLAQLIIVVLVGSGIAQAQSAPQLKNAVSRKLQGGKAFDIALPLTGGSGIECRSGDSLSVVLTFDQPISSANVALNSGNAAISGTPVVSGNTITVNLVNVANAQDLKLTATNVTPVTGGAFGTASISVRVLEGDINSDGVVDEQDLSLVKALASNKSVSGFNFRSDDNLSGSISGADVTRVKSRLGSTIPSNRVATYNTAPVVGTIAEQKIFSGVTSRNVAFAVSDNESTAASLAVAATSDNQALISDSGISISGSGGARIISFTPASKQTGIAHVIVSVSDGLTTTTQQVAVQVSGQPTLYLAIMTPQSGAVSTGSGFATLQVSADETYAILNFQYSNLSTPVTGEHIHGPADPGQSAGILFDIDTASPNQDGSRTWTFVPVGTNTVADIVNAIKTGHTYINIHTSKYPSGEIRGQFLLSTGSQTFTPPPPPPALPSGPPTQQDAGRFLQQATFGANDQLLAQVQAMGFDAWINQQFQMPPTLVTPILLQRQANGEVLNDPQWSEGWWNVSLTAPDQLRQRVAFALSEIVVISQTGAGLNERPLAIANYYDMLLKDAFKNYRTILEDVTLNP